MATITAADVNKLRTALAQGLERKLLVEADGDFDLASKTYVKGQSSCKSFR
jgi:translation elongation factor EF-Ts